MGLPVSVGLPAFAGGTTLEPAGERLTPGPAAATTWLFVTSSGMSRIDVSLLRAHFGKRSVTSKSFSPSTIVVSALPPTAHCTRLLTSAALTPHLAHFSGSTRNSRLVWPLML